MEDQPLIRQRLGESEAWREIVRVRVLQTARITVLAANERVRLPVDEVEVRQDLVDVVQRLGELGVSKRKVIVYTLFNYIDAPENFFHRVRDLLNWGAVCYLRARQQTEGVPPGRLELSAEERQALGSAAQSRAKQLKRLTQLRPGTRAAAPEVPEPLKGDVPGRP